MKHMIKGLLATTLILSMGSVNAADQKDESVGKKVTHGATGVGQGIKKIYHEAAKGVHKVIARNSDNPHTINSHMRKAHKQKVYAARSEHRAKKELKKAK
jgi:hypothetical protein